MGWFWQKRLVPYKAACDCTHVMTQKYFTQKDYPLSPHAQKSIKECDSMNLPETIFDPEIWGKEIAKAYDRDHKK